MPTAYEQVVQNTICEQDLTPVSLAAARLFDEFPCDLFRVDPDSGRSLLFSSQRVKASRENLAQLSAHGERTLYARAQDRLRCQQALESQLERLIERDDLSAADRLGALLTVIDPLVKLGFATFNTERVLRETARIGPQIVSVLGRGDIVTAEVFQILGHDQHTFTHVVNVASYCVLLAGLLGIHDPLQLKDIATAGLLHDLGKRFIATRILCKRSALNAEEREVIQTHPAKGYQELLRVGGATETQLMITYQHHERPDGKGYPVGAGYGEIHPLARLSSVVDVFDALTCDRPYRRGLPLSTTLDMMQRQSGLQFDAEMLRCWQSAMQEN